MPPFDPDRALRAFLATPSLARAATRERVAVRVELDPAAGPAPTAPAAEPQGRPASGIRHPLGAMLGRSQVLETAPAGTHEVTGFWVTTKPR